MSMKKANVLLRDEFVKKLLDDISKEIKPPKLDKNVKNVIVEFSSPNIAKPFHVGHLRSTMIGNYVANMNKFMNNNVRKINYLGDWGTQFGLIQMGTKLANITDDQMKKDPINALYKAYVIANKLSTSDSTVLQQARNIFLDLELGNDEISESWESFRKYTTDELKSTYSRLNIEFDEYHWESMYRAKNIQEMITSMKNMNLLTMDEENRQVVSLETGKNVPFIKSDGTTLYITRDVAAAIDRFEKYKFDIMYYVVDNSQKEHFNDLIAILHKMKIPWADRLKFIGFGRIQGLKTRKGGVTFLHDILNEAKTTMRQKQSTLSTTKVSLDITDNSSDILGLSTIIINDFKHRRDRDYKFNWNSALDVNGTTGVKLQYSHCRLVSLELNSGATVASECDPSLLKEPEVDDLVTIMGKFDEVFVESYNQLEPSILVNYLFNLSHSANKALRTLRVKGETTDVAGQRLLLFRSTRNLLSQGMNLLGIQPLDKM